MKSEGCEPAAYCSKVFSSAPVAGGTGTGVGVTTGGGTGVGVLTWLFSWTSKTEKRTSGLVRSLRKCNRTYRALVPAGRVLDSRFQEAFFSAPVTGLKLTPSLETSIV